MLDEKTPGGVGQIDGQINWPQRGDAASDASGDAPKLDLHGVVETALAEALILAARAGRWEIVERIAAELGERRVSRSTASVSTEPGANNARTPVGDRRDR